MFEVYARTPERMDIGAVADHARRAERLGFDGLLVSEPIHDGLLLACQALAATSTLRVSTGVLVAFPRSPMTVAVAAWDLQRMSKGRFELGLGSQIRQNIEQRYASIWPSSAVGAMKDYVLALRAIFKSFQTDEHLDHRGAFYQLTRLQPLFNPGPIDHPDIPLILGAVGPKMLGVCGEVADGLHTHPTNTSPRYLRDVVRPALAAGACAAGRSPNLVEITIFGMIATGANEKEVKMELDRHRSLLAFLYSTPAYWPSLAFSGRQDLGERLLAATRAKNWAELPELIDDALMEELVVSGTYGEIGALLKARYSGLAGRLIFPLSEDPSNDENVRCAVEELKS